MPNTNFVDHHHGLIGFLNFLFVHQTSTIGKLPEPKSNRCWRFEWKLKNSDDDDEAEVVAAAVHFHKKKTKTNKKQFTRANGGVKSVKCIFRCYKCAFLFNVPMQFYYRCFLSISHWAQHHGTVYILFAVP